VLVSTPVPNSRGGRNVAEARLRAFATVLVATLERTGILPESGPDQR
jgi:hypothetical protein